MTAPNSPGRPSRLIIPPPPGPFDWPQPDERDVGAARDFGEQHAGIFGGIRVEGPRIHVGLTVLEPHADDLRQKMRHPEALDIELATYTEAQLKAFQQQIAAKLRPLRGIFQGIGIGFQELRLSLGAAGVAVARELHEEFGELLTIRVGGRTFPPDGKPVTPREAPTATCSFPGLVVSTELASGQVQAGDRISGEVELRNEGTDVVAFGTDQPLVACVIDAEGLVVGSFSGVIAGSGRRINLDPGAACRIRFVGGTAGGSGDRYSTPPGEYTVVVVVPVRYGEPEGQLISDPADLLITEPN